MAKVQTAPTGRTSLLTLQQASAQTGVPYTSIRDLVLQGHLPRVQLGQPTHLGQAIGSRSLHRELHREPLRRQRPGAAQLATEALGVCERGGSHSWIA